MCFLVDYNKKWGRLSISIKEICVESSLLQQKLSELTASTEIKGMLSPNIRGLMEREEFFSGDS